MIAAMFLFIGSFFLLFWHYAVYLSFLWALNLILKRKKQERRTPLDLASGPSMSLIIPTYNEEKHILQKIRNSLSLEYPPDKLEIIVVDSASLDRTTELAETFINGLPAPQKSRLILCRQPERRGKGAAINFALGKARGEVVVVTDANCLLNKEALRFLAPHYQSPAVGAVGGRFQVLERGRKFEKQNKAYWLREEKLRRLESRLHSMIGMSGEIGSFRRGLVRYDENSTAEDLELSFRIREKGSRVIYEPKALALEEVPRTGRGLRIQKKRVVIGTITSLWKHKHLVGNPAFGWYGILVVPSHKILQIFSPWLAIVFLLSGEILLFHLAGTALGLGLNGLVLFLLGLLVLGKTSLAAFFEYWLLSQVITIEGWLDFFRGKYSVNWEKDRD
jgi:biofilm PGA synthesis N-glycosyltransferase PgaC